MRIVLALLLVISTNSMARAATFETEKVKISVERIAEGLSHPWAIDFLPDGSMIVTERGGKMRIVSKTGGLGEPLKGLPDVDVGGQGGLLDVTLHPNFAEQPPCLLELFGSRQGRQLDRSGARPVERGWHLAPRRHGHLLAETQGSQPAAFRQPHCLRRQGPSLRDAGRAFAREVSRSGAGSELAFGQGRPAHRGRQGAVRQPFREQAGRAA